MNPLPGEGYPALPSAPNSIKIKVLNMPISWQLGCSREQNHCISGWINLADEKMIIFKALK
jgi:hypothetical protein